MNSRSAQDIPELFSQIGIDKNYEDLDFTGLTYDIQGWGQEHSILQTAIRDIRPALVIEVGTWKGASVIKMIETAKQEELDTKFICVDTWLGSHVDLWKSPDYRKSLMLRHGFPTMFRQFIYNLINASAIDYVFPLPMTSSSAAALISSMNIRADIVYIDAGHSEEDVKSDVEKYYQILNVGGMMIGDDYSEHWPGVVKAVNLFCAEHGIILRSDEEKWWFTKKVDF